MCCRVGKNRAAFALLAESHGLEPDTPGGFFFARLERRARLSCSAAPPRVGLPLLSAVPVRHAADWLVFCHTCNFGSGVPAMLDF